MIYNNKYFDIKGTNALMCMITGSFVQEYLARQATEIDHYSVGAYFAVGTTSVTADTVTITYK